MSSSRPLGPARRAALLCCVSAFLFEGPASAQTAPRSLSPVVVQGGETARRSAKPGRLPRRTAARRAVARRAPASVPVAATVTGATAPDAAAPASLSTAAAGETRGTATSLQLDRPNQSGSRLGLTPRQTPASVDIVSAETIREHGEHRLIDAITDNATGFTALPAPGNGGSSLATRGFTGPGSVMQLLDGTRLYVGAGTVTFPFDTWSAERIEVLRGPASVLYGEGAIGGIVDIVSKQPVMTRLQGEIEGTLGTHGTRRIGVDVGGPVDPHWAFRFAYSGNASNGYVNAGQFSNDAFLGALRYEPTGDVTVTLTENFGAQHPAKYFGVPLVNGQLDSALRTMNYNVADANIHYADDYTQLKAKWQATPGVDIDNTAYFLETHRHYHDVENYAFSPVTNLVTRTNYIEIYHTEYQVGDRLAATFRGDVFGAKNTFLVGGDANDISFKRTGNTPYPGTSMVPLLGGDPGEFVNLTPNGTHPEFNSRTMQASVFAEDRFEIVPQFALVAGGRYEVPTIERTDLVANTSFQKTFHYATYRIGAVYTPVPGLAFYGQYATAVDGVTNLISLAVTQQQFSLSPGNQVEVGVKNDFWGGRGEATLAAYQIVKHNLLTVDPTTLLTNQVGEQSSRGIEASGSLRVTDEVRLNANMAVLRAKYDSFIMSSGGVAVNYAGKVPLNVPQQVGNLGVAYAFLPGWEARVQLHYVGKIYGDYANAVPMPSYGILNAQLEWHPLPQLSLTGRVYNIANALYATSATATQAVLGPPRTFELALNYKF